MTILVVGADAARGRAALMTALASAALGEPVRIFFQDGAVRLVDRGEDRDALFDEVRSAGIELIACQTGLAANHLRFDDLIDGVEPGGLVSVLAAASGDRLLVF